LSFGNANCDSNCLNGTDMTLQNNTITGFQTTTSKSFSYFVGNSCNGFNLMNDFSDGHQTTKEYNSSTCGYVYVEPVFSCKPYYPGYAYVISGIATTPCYFP
jgi:hypothetical protein